MREIKAGKDKFTYGPIIPYTTREKIKEKTKELERAKKSFIPLEKSRANTIEALNEYINIYIQSAKDVSGTYSEAV